MKLKCQRAGFASAFQTVAAVVPSRTPKAILQNVKLICTQQETVLIGTDGDVGMRTVVENIEREGQGEVLLPTSRLLSILRELRDDELELDIGEDSVVIRTSHSEFKLPTEDPAEFPNVVPFDEPQYAVIAGDLLKQMIRRTIFATDPESTRYALGGILLELTPERISLVATDSRRLALCQGPCTYHGGDITPATNPVIPSKAMQLIEKSLDDTDETLHLAIHTNDVLVQYGQTTIYSRLVEGRFPRYRDVIPAESKIEIPLICGPVYGTVRQALIFTSEESRGVDFTFGEGKMVLRSQAADIGESRVELPISYDAETLTTRFDPRFVADFLKVLDPETQFALRMNDPDSAAVLQTEDGYIYVVMPLERDR